MITIHYDYVNGTEVSYAEGKALGDDFTTCCLDFFTTDKNTIVLKKNRDYLYTVEILLNTGSYTKKKIRKAHNLVKLLKADGLMWQNLNN